MRGGLGRARGFGAHGGVHRRQNAGTLEAKFYGARRKRRLRVHRGPPAEETRGATTWTKGDVTARRVPPHRLVHPRGSDTNGAVRRQQIGKPPRFRAAVGARVQRGEGEHLRAAALVPRRARPRGERPSTDRARPRGARGPARRRRGWQGQGRASRRQRVSPRRRRFEYDVQRRRRRRDDHVRRERRRPIARAHLRAESRRGSRVRRQGGPKSRRGASRRERAIRVRSRRGVLPRANRRARFARAQSVDHVAGMRQGRPTTGDCQRAVRGGGAGDGPQVDFAVTGAHG